MSIRPTRSRKDRPCDRCRKQKQTCQILTRGQPCVLCAKTGKPCTFASPSVNRHRPTTASRAKDELQSGSRTAGGPTDAWRTHSATTISSSWKGKAKAKPSHPLLALLDNLDRDYSRESSVVRNEACARRLMTHVARAMIPTIRRSTWKQTIKKNPSISDRLHLRISRYRSRQRQVW